MSDQPRRVSVSLGTLGLLLQVAGVVLIFLAVFGVLAGGFNWPWFGLGLWLLGSLLG